MQRDILSGEKGSVILLVAAGMTFFLGLLGLVADVGYIYWQRVILSNAVDAAALAGVQELPSAPVLARYRATDYALANRVHQGEVDVITHSQNTRITVEAARTVELFFMGLLGRPTTRVGASATAEVGSVAGVVRGVAPFGVVWEDFVVGQQYMLKYDPHTGGGSSGNFGALALGGTGASNYRRNIVQGYPGRLRVDEQVLTETGNMAGPTNRGLTDRLAQGCSCQYPPTKVTCPRILTVPIIDSLDIGGRDYVLIMGFAAFFVEDIGRNDASVTGRFVEMAVDGEIGRGGDYGLVSYRLVN